MSNVLTGALAIVKIRGTEVGKMRSISASENVQRSDVRGIGTIITKETPPVAWNGTLNCGFYEINFDKQGLAGAIRRDVQTTQEFEDNLLLDDEGIQVDVYKKVEDFIDPATGQRRAKTEPYAIIKRVFIDSESFDINEGTVSGHNQSFRFLSPIIYPQ